jgi:hypothetical protein
MATPNLFDDLKKALSDFKTFLDANVGAIKPVVKPLDALTGGRVTELINKLIALMNELEAEVDKLGSSTIPGLDKFTAFTQNVTTLLQASKSLLPNEASTIDEILGAANVVTSLPTIGQVKDEIKTLIESIKTDLNNLIS